MITSDEHGVFSFPSIDPSSYNVTVDKVGFKSATIENIRALVNTDTDVPVVLSVGSNSETVTVTASQTTLNTTDASLGNSFEQERIQELPLDARNIVYLLSLQPGVTRTGEVNGGRRDQSNVTLDGTDNNFQVSGLDPISSQLGLGNQAFGSVLRSTPDSVEEFRTVTSLADASFGRSSGAQVALVTRSGTDKLHGSLYYFNRNTRFSANDWFNNFAGHYVATDPQVLQGIAKAGDERAPRPELNRNLFGGSLGGRIPHSRFYYFANYEGLRDFSQTAVARTVPTASFAQGILQYQNTANGTTAVSPTQFAALFPVTGGENSTVLTQLQAAPAPNYSGLGDGLNLTGYRFNAATPATNNTGIVRFDYPTGSSMKLFARLNYQDDHFQLAREFPNSRVPQLWVHPYGALVGHDWTIGQNKVNLLRVGFTREAYSQLGDADFNIVRFYTYRPTLEQRSNTLTSPVLNITDDFNWVRGQHQLQIGGNIRLIRSNPVSYANSFDLLSTSYAYYSGSGSVLSAPLAGVSSAFTTNARAAVAILLGRVSQYTANVLYDKSGVPLPSGTAAARSFATQEYEMYAQDVWRPTPTFTVTYGLRYSLARPIYERNGFQTAPSVNLSSFLAARAAGAAAGVPYNQPISFDLAGPANGRGASYNMSLGDVAPVVSFAKTFSGQSGVAKRLIGGTNESVLRGGFRMLYDRFGSALIPYLNQYNSLGFNTSSGVTPGVWNVTTNLPPLYTGSTDTRSFPYVAPTVPLQFPRTYPSDGSARTDVALDSSMKTPRQYLFNLSYGRNIGKTFTVEASYVGRLANHLLASRDAAQPVNLTAPAGGQNWYQGAGVLAQLHDAGLQLGSAGFNQAVPRIAFFEDLFPGSAIQQAAAAYYGKPLPALNGLSPSQQAAALVAKGVNGLNNTNWVQLQRLLNNYSRLGVPAFVDPQYASLETYSTVGSSNYHGASVSVRERLGDDLIFDVNYTFSKSMDNVSALEGGDGGPNFGSLILNAFNPGANYALSDYDTRHVLNVNFLAGLPVGRGKRFGSHFPGYVNALVAGWQLAGVMRANSGLPFSINDATGTNATAVQQSSHGVLLRPLQAKKSIINGVPFVFSDPTYAYQSFRNPRAGETGSRNVLRLPGYQTLDASLHKDFHLPRGEADQLELRWEVFNVTNTQPFGGLAYANLSQDPYANSPQSNFGQFSTSQTAVGEQRPGRVMQFAARYSF